MERLLYFHFTDKETGRHWVRTGLVSGVLSLGDILWAATCFPGPKGPHSPAPSDMGTPSVPVTLSPWVVMLSVVETPADLSPWLLDLPSGWSHDAAGKRQRAGKNRLSLTGPGGFRAHSSDSSGLQGTSRAA